MTATKKPARKSAKKKTVTVWLFVVADTVDGPYYYRANAVKQRNLQTGYYRVGPIIKVEVPL